MQASFQCFQRTAVATVCAAVWLMQFMPAAAQAQTGDAGHRQDCEVRVTDAPLEFRQFDKVELTGSAIIDAESRQALPVDVVCRRRIDNSGVSHLAELVQKWPGLLRMTDNVAAQGLSGIGPLPAAVHGHQEGTLVLLNGRRLTPYGSQGLAGERAVVDLDVIPLSAIDHVDIMTDGASSRYGSDATAGVINMITRPVTAGAAARLHTRSGGGRLANVSWGSGRYSPSGLSLQVHLEAETQDALRLGDVPALLDATAAWASPAATTVRPALDKQLLFADLQWALTADWRLWAHLLAGHTHLDSRMDRQYAPLSPGVRAVGGVPPVIWLPADTAALPLHTQKREHQQVMAGVRGRWQDWALNGSLSTGRHQVLRLQTPAPDTAGLSGTLDDGISRLQALDLLGSRTVAEIDGMPVNLGLGLNWRDEALQYATPLPGFAPLDVRRRHQALHGEWQTPLSHDQSLTLALRHDRYSDVGGVNTGKLGWRWQPVPAFMMRASMGNGFRAPTLGQRSTLQMPALQVRDPLGGGQVAVRMLGSPLLGPERTRHRTLGLRLSPVPHWTLGLDLWSVSARDTFGLLPFDWMLQDPALRAHYLDMDSTGQLTLRAPNLMLGRSQVRGLDYEWQWRRPVEAGLLRLEFKGTAYLRSAREDRASGSLVSDLGRLSPLTGTVMPRHQMMLAAQLDRERWHGGVRLHYRHGHWRSRWPDGQPLRVQPHWTLDLISRWDLLRQLQISVIVHNLFNRVAIPDLGTTGMLTPIHPRDDSLQGRSLRLQADYRF